MSSTNRSFSVVVLEDSENDAFLITRQLRKTYPNIEVHTAMSQADYVAKLAAVKPDLIISDYRLPQYSGIEALMFARAHTPVTPFIFVTGALHNEELAADTILKGASGFVLKNNLEKLNQIVPPLLTEPSTGLAETAPATTPAATSVEAPALDDVVEKLQDADPATLAKIKALLGGDS